MLKAQENEEYDEPHLPMLFRRKKALTNPVAFWLTVFADNGIIIVNLNYGRIGFAFQFNVFSLGVSAHGFDN